MSAPAPVIEYMKTSVRALDMAVEPIPGDAPLTAPDLITNSRMETWNLCRRKAQYRYVDGYDAKMPGAALLFGTAWHKFMEYWWAGRRDPAELEERVFQPYRAPMDRLTFLYFEEMARGYDRVHAEEAKAYEVIRIEEEFRAPLFDPSQTTNHGQFNEVSGTYMIGGKLDLLLRRVADGAVGLGEHKTTKQKIESDADPFWDKLVMDHQDSVYTIGADSLGYEVTWSLRDVARKPSIRPDKRKGEDVDIEKFRARLRAEIEAEPRSYFRWREIPRQSKEIFNALRDVWDTARLMEVGEKGTLAPRNPAACFKFGSGNRCVYYDTCLGSVSLNENPELIRKAPFSELEVPEDE